MHAHHGVPLAAVERATQRFELCGADVAAGAAGHAAVDQDDAPGAHIDVTADLERRLRQCGAQPRGVIVIARHAVDRFAESRQQPCEVRVAARLVVDDVAVAQHGVRAARIGCGMREHLLQRRQCLHAAQPALGAGEQVWIGDQQQLDVCIHVTMLHARIVPPSEAHQAPLRCLKLSK